QEIVHLIEVCVKRFDHTLKKLTELARTDNIELERVRYPLRLALDSAKERLHKAVEETNTRITCGRLPTVMVDPDLIVIVFQNLLHNAIKFRRGDECTIRVDARRQGTCWVIRVRDDGVGVDPEMVPQLFEMAELRRAGGARDGTGLGLGICQRII